MTGEPDFLAALRYLSGQVVRSAALMSTVIHPTNCRCTDCRPDPDDRLRQLGFPIRVLLDPSLPDDAIVVTPSNPYALNHTAGCPMRDRQASCTCGVLARHSAVIAGSEKRGVDEAGSSA